MKWQANADGTGTMTATEEEFRCIADSLAARHPAVAKLIRDHLAALSPSPPSARERLLAVLPKHTEEPTISWDYAQWPTLCQLINDGLVNIYFNAGDRPFGFRLAPPVEVDVEGLAERLHNFSGVNWHAKTESTKDEWRGIAKTAITALRRRQDLDVSEVVRVRDYAKAAAVRSGACPESAYFACIADHLARWLASRPKAEPVNAELLEAARAWYRGGIERGYSFSFPTQLRLIDAIARADAASKGKTGEELPKPDPAVTREWVRELVARAMEYDGPEDTPTYIRAGKCDPEVK